ncbi:MAG TPA: TetR/AcrR family transcriptional regulator C-terminal domain-containing protein [Mycobacterium sp.]
MADPTERRRRTRNSLSRNEVVQAAMRIADRDGLESLTFSNLGKELGAHKTAVYRYFQDKDELLLTLVDTLQEEALRDFTPAEDWRETLREHALRTRAVYMRHPQIGQRLATRTARSEHEFRTVEIILSALRSTGLPDSEVARYYRVFDDFVLASASLEAALAALDPQTRERDLLAWRVDYPQVTADRYPTIAALAAHLPALDDPANFELALDLMLDSIELRVEHHRRP